MTDRVEIRIASDEYPDGFPGAWLDLDERNDRGAYVVHLNNEEVIQLCAGISLSNRERAKVLKRMF